MTTKETMIGDRQRRLSLDRRADYATTSRFDFTIVNLLSRQIDAAIRTYAVTGSRVLDVGCGRQPFRPLLESLRCLYKSMDVDQNTDQTVTFVEAIDGQLSRELMSSGPYDLIICTEVLEHVPDWPKAFANLSSLTAKAGKVLITCPFFYPLHEEPYDYWRPTTYAVAYYASKVGLSVVQTEAAGDSWDVLATLLGCTFARPRSHRFHIRLFAKSARFVANIAYHIANSRFVRNRIILEGKFHLSTIAVLERS